MVAGRARTVDGGVAAERRDLSPVVADERGRVRAHDPDRRHRKLRLRLVERDVEGIWNETTSPAFSPVLRRSNRYQLIQKFLEWWIVSKLSFGNTYVLKERDARAVVTAMHVLDPQRVTPLIAPDGAVYYELRRDELGGVPANRDQPDRGVVVPASEIIHDLMVPLFHPLVGVSPMRAAWSRHGRACRCRRIARRYERLGAGRHARVPGSTRPAPTNSKSIGTNYTDQRRRVACCQPA